jgi:hypothetical protein
VQADFEVIDQRTVAHEDILCIEKRIGTWLSAYAKAINERYHRHRSLFQRHTKAKIIHEESYFLLLGACCSLHLNCHSDPPVGGEESGFEVTVEFTDFSLRSK